MMRAKVTPQAFTAMHALSPYLYYSTLSLYISAFSHVFVYRLYVYFYTLRFSVLCLFSCLAFFIAYLARFEFCYLHISEILFSICTTPLNFFVCVIVHPRVLFFVLKIHSRLLFNLVTFFNECLFFTTRFLCLCLKRLTADMRLSAVPR